MFILTSVGYVETRTIVAILSNEGGTANVLTVGGHNLQLTENFIDFSKRFFDETEDGDYERMPRSTASEPSESVETKQP